MAYSIGDVKAHLTGMGHTGTLNRVKNFEYMCERAANTMLMKVRPLETMYLAELSQAIHDQIYDYPIQSYFGALIDIYPVDNRTSLDDGSRSYAEDFDRRKALDTNKISIESRGGLKFARINWPVSAPTVLNALDSLTANGTWSAFGTAANLATDTQRFMSGSGSVAFDLVTTGDGIKNTTMAALNLASLDTAGDFFAWVYFPAVTNLTSVTLVWGTNVTTKYWTSVAQTTQSDGTAFAAGWNLLRFPWSTATKTSTPDDTAINSAKLTVAATGAITGIRVDNIIVSKGRYFDIKAYSKYLFQTASGTWEARPTTNSDDDLVMLDVDALQIFLLELLIAMAQQLEGTDSGFDIGWAQKELYGDPAARASEGRMGLYRMYKGYQPDQRKRVTAGYYAPGGRISRGRW